MTKFRLRREEELGDGFHRVITGLADDSIRHLRDMGTSNVVEPIHEARKSCKKARAALKLVRSAVPVGYETANRLFRDSARALAPLRDPHAVLDTFDSLVAVRAGTLPSVGLPTVRARLRKSAAIAADAAMRDRGDRVTEAVALIEEGREVVSALSVPDESHVVGDGVRRTYRRGRKRMKEAQRRGDPEAFHEWRKDVKYLWYQLRLLRDSAPSLLKPLNRALSRLSDALGDAHDLAVLIEEASRIDIPAEEAAMLGSLVEGAGSRLEDRSLRLGRRLYVEKPRAFADRIEGYWEIWREWPELEVGGISEVYPDEPDSVTHELSTDEAVFLDDPRLAGLPARLRTHW